MLVIRIKKEQNVVGEIKYTVNDLKRLGLKIEYMADAKFWSEVVEIIAQSIFKNYEDVDSVFAYDSKYEDLAHLIEIFNKRTVEEEEQNPAYYDWDYTPTEEELSGEPIDCEEF